jgi:flagellar basal body rod protein FlgG
MVQELGFGVHGSRFTVHGSGFRVQGSGFRVQGSGFRVQGTTGSCYEVRENYEPGTLNSKPYTLYPIPQNQNPKLQVLNPAP